MNLAWIACMFLVLTAAVFAGDGPPVAPVREVVDEFYGVKVPDPYRYMENLEDPQVQAWIKGQADYAKKVLSGIPGRDALLKRIEELDAGAPYRIGVVKRWPNGDLHYLKTMAKENLAKLYFRDGKTGEEKLLVDPEKLGNDGKHVALEFVVPSPDERYVAYGLAAAGSEQTVLHVLDMKSGENLAETIDRMEADYTPPYWLSDSSAFVYSRRQYLPADAPETEGYKHTRSYLHKLGTNPDEDRVVFSMEEGHGAGMLDTDFPSVVLTAGSKWAIGKIKHGDAPELTLYAAPAEEVAAGQYQWQKICDAGDQVVGFAVHGDECYLVTATEATRYRVVKVALARPGFAEATTVVPQSKAVVQSVSVAHDALYVNSLDGGLNTVRRVRFGSDAVEQIRLPAGESCAFATAANPEMDGVLLATTSWVRAGKLYAYDPATGAITDTHLQPEGKFDDPQGYEAEEVLVKSHDGVMVPLSIVHKAGMKLDGSHPTIVSGYGAYGMSTHVHFSPISLGWLERGGILAYAHVRGGGDYGREWHLAGQKATKPNTWKDFIACCEYLVQKGYTSPAKLAGSGGSAGGILIGRAITERPDLFAAAMIHVGCTDAIRMETTTNGVPNIAEFGSVKTPQGFKALLEMSAYAHVKKGVKYPAVLLTHGINDPRVEPWMSAKMTARLQAATSSGRPILFRVDYDAGHGIGSTKRQRQEEVADGWAFLLWQMGEIKTP